MINVNIMFKVYARHVSLQFQAHPLAILKTEPLRYVFSLLDNNFNPPPSSKIPHHYIDIHSYRYHH